MNNIITRYQIKESENNTWEDVSEKTILEMLATRFDRLTPVLSELLQGKEIITAHESYRRINCKGVLWLNCSLNIRRRSICFTLNN